MDKQETIESVKKELKKYKSMWNKFKKGLSKCSIITDKSNVGFWDGLMVTAVESISRIFLNHMTKIEKGYYICPKCNNKIHDKDVNLWCKSCVEKYNMEIENNELCKQFKKMIEESGINKV